MVSTRAPDSRVSKKQNGLFLQNPGKIYIGRHKEGGKIYAFCIYFTGVL